MISHDRYTYWPSSRMRRHRGYLSWLFHSLLYQHILTIQIPINVSKAVVKPSIFWCFTQLYTSNFWWDRGSILLHSPSKVDQRQALPVFTGLPFMQITRGPLADEARIASREREHTEYWDPMIIFKLSLALESNIDLPWSYSITISINPQVY